MSCPACGGDLKIIPRGLKIVKKFGSSHLCEHKCEDCEKSIYRHSIGLARVVFSGGGGPKPTLAVQEEPRWLLTADWESKDGGSWDFFILPPKHSDEHPLVEEIKEYSTASDHEIHESVSHGFYIRQAPRLFFQDGKCTWFSRLLQDTRVDLVIELAHLRRKTEVSKSQVLSLPQLEELHSLQSSKDENLRVFEFPNSINDRLHIELKTYELVKGKPQNHKNRDPENMAAYLNQRRELIPRRFFPDKSYQNGDDFSKLDDDARAQITVQKILKEARIETNFRLNVLRSVPNYSLEGGQDTSHIRDSHRRIFDQVDHAIELIEDGMKIYQPNQEQMDLLKRWFRIVPYPSAGDLEAEAGKRIGDLNVASVKDIRTILRQNPEMKQIDLADHGFFVMKNTGAKHLPPGVKIRVPFIQQRVPGALEEKWLDAGSELSELPKEEAWGLVLSDLGKAIPPSDGNKISRIGTGTSMFPSLTTVMALYVLVIEDDGISLKLRCNGDGKFVGVDFIWSRMLTMSPFKGKVGGVARANLMMYGLNPHENSSPAHESMRYVPFTSDDAKAKFERRQLQRREWRKACKLLIRIFRDGMRHSEVKRKE